MLDANMMYLAEVVVTAYLLGYVGVGFVYFLLRSRRRPASRPPVIPETVRVAYKVNMVRSLYGQTHGQGNVRHEYFRLPARKERVVRPPTISERLRRAHKIDVLHDLYNRSD